jgi:DnaJ-class molecular chaperone
MKNYYEILEITDRASDEVIKAAYKALIKKYHPDNGQVGDPTGEKMRLVNEAYQCLSNPDSKRTYDRELQSADKNFNGKETQNQRTSQYAEDVEKTNPNHPKGNGIFSKIVVGTLQGIQDAMDQRHAEVENAYLEGVNMLDYTLVREYKEAVGAKRVGYGKALEERGFLIRDSRGNLKPTEKYRRM